jgi:hypothetical protein
MTRKLAQKGNPLPEEQQAKEDEENPCQDYDLAYALRTHTK